jgi:broad specificity phosphatase PhoE
VTRTLVIVRHGNTFAPDETPRRIGARTDLPLVASGQEQARRLGAWFADEGWRFDQILCAPLQRAQGTAEAIRAALPDPPPAEPSPLLAEIDHGPDENRSEAEVVARIGADALHEWDRHGVAPLDWPIDREARLDGWRRLLRAVPDETVLLVTSNGAARFALLAEPALASQARALPSLKLRTGAFGIVQVDDGGPRLVSWDRRP